MDYKSARTIITVVVPLIAVLCTLITGIYLRLDGPNLFTTVTLSYLPWTIVGWLIWSLYRIHHLERMLDRTSVTANDIKTIYNATGSFKYYKCISQAELDDFVTLTYKKLSEEIKAEPTELMAFIQAGVCIHYNFLWKGENCSGLEETKRTTESYYDRIKLINHFQNGM